MATKKITLNELRRLVKKVINESRSDFESMSDTEFLDLMYDKTLPMSDKDVLELIRNDDISDRNYKIKIENIKKGSQAEVYMLLKLGPDYFKYFRDDHRYIFDYINSNRDKNGYFAEFVGSMVEEFFTGREGIYQLLKILKLMFGEYTFEEYDIKRALKTLDAENYEPEDRYSSDYDDNYDSGLSSNQQSWQDRSDYANDMVRSGRWDPDQAAEYKAGA